MKILFATMQFGRGYGQGTERYIIMLAQRLTELGHNVAVLGGDPEHRGPQLPLGQEYEQDPRVLYYPTHGWTAVRGVPDTNLDAVLTRGKPDLIHMVNPGHIGVGLIAAARRANIPTVITIVDYWWLCPKHILLHDRRGICDSNVHWMECVRCIGAVDSRRWVRVLANLPLVRATALPALYLLRSLLRGATLADARDWTRRQTILRDTLNAADAVIFLSDGARNRIAPRLNHRRTHTIVVGMEPRWFEAGRSTPRDTTRRPPSELTLGFVGALADHKGTHLILQAAHQLNWTNTRIRIAGSGPDTTYQRRLTALATGLNVEFVGRVPSADVPAFLRSLDALIVPSTWPENLPQTVLEAQAVGTPVIASRVDGISEVIADDSMLFDAASAPDLARCLKAWADSPRQPPPAKPVRSVDDMVTDTLAVYSGLSGTRPT